MHSDSHATTHTELHTTPGTASTRVYGELKTRLLLGEFPSNLRLAEERLGTQFGVSRTPVREALLRLHAEGIVVRHPDGGYCPAVPDVISMRNLYELRMGIERMALVRPGRLGRHHDHALLEPLRDEWRTMDAAEARPDPEFVLLDEAFHCTLAEAAGNPAIVDTLRAVNERVRLVRMQDFLLPGRVEATIAQHVAIVEAVLADDLAAAEARFDHHVGESYEHVAEQVLLVLSRMARLPDPAGDR